MRIIHVLRKPLSEGTVAANTLKHGCGGINIDASRVGTEQVFTHSRGSNQAFPKRPGETSVEESGRKVRQDILDHAPRTGRWPANVILQHLDGCRCDGVKRVSTGYWGKPTRGATPKGSRAAYSDGLDGTRESVGYGDSDGKESVANWVCEPGCPVARLDEQSGVTTSTGGRIGNAQGVYSNQGRTGWGTGHEAGNPGFGDSGGASRFYKQVGGEK